MAINDGWAVWSDEEQTPDVPVPEAGPREEEVPVWQPDPTPQPAGNEAPSPRWDANDPTAVRQWVDGTVADYVASFTVIPSLREFVGLAEDTIRDEHANYMGLWDQLTPEWRAYMASDDGCAYTAFRLQARSFLHLVAEATKRMCDAYEADMKAIVNGWVPSTQSTVDLLDAYRRDSSEANADGFENEVRRFAEHLATQLPNPFIWADSRLTQTPIVESMRVLENIASTPKADSFPMIPDFAFQQPDDVLPPNAANMRDALSLLERQLTNPVNFHGLDYCEIHDAPRPRWDKWALPEDWPKRRAMGMPENAKPTLTPIPPEGRFKDEHEASKAMDAIADEWMSYLENTSGKDDLFTWLDERVDQMVFVPDSLVANAGLWGPQWVKYVRTPQGSKFIDFYRLAFRMEECARLFTHQMKEARHEDIRRLAGVWAFEQPDFKQALMAVDGSQESWERFRDLYRNVVRTVDAELPPASCWMPVGENVVKQIIDITLAVPDTLPDSLPTIPNIMLAVSDHIPEDAKSMRACAEHIRAVWDKGEEQDQQETVKPAGKQAEPQPLPDAPADPWARAPQSSPAASPYEYAPEPPMPDDYYDDAPIEEEDIPPMEPQPNTVPKRVPPKDDGPHLETIYIPGVR